MKYTLILKQKAADSIEESYTWYEERQIGLGDAFLFQLEAVLNKIQSYPEYFGITDKNFRTASLGRFPFLIVFDIIDSQVVIFNVFHTARNPSDR